MKTSRNKTRIATYALSILVLLSISTLLTTTASSTLVRQAETLTSVKVTTTPTMDGDATDSAWAKATSITIATVGGSGAISVTLKAVHTDTDLYVLAQWDDSTMSMTRSGSWNWDGTAWTTTEADQSEDRIAFLWNINMSNFYTAGCMAKCHLQYGEAGAFLENPEETGDIWHMKAARSLGVISASQSGTLTVDPETHEVTAGSVTMNGYIDDKYITYEDPADLPEDGGRHGDSGSSTYSRNRNADKTGPLYLEVAPANYIDAMVLTQSEIDGGETLEVATATIEQITTSWNKYAQFDAIVPERILRPPSGSRGDVMQSATWSNGTWTSEFKRALITKTDGATNTDDVQFTDLTLPYGFSIAVMDNKGGGTDHSQATSTYALSFGEVVSELEIGFEIVTLFVALDVILLIVAANRRRRTA
ncbi:MAG: ethylbenzene dehydrogenase-related protein [Candidatus Heimdallarchaeota archaeon]